MKKPRNTSLSAASKPGFLLAQALTKSASGLITDQEKDGQTDFVTSDTLPTKIDAQTKKKLEDAGVKFLGPVKHDNLFQYVKLPAGWKKKPTDHSMWSDLVDDKGVKRASIFYKAAFYDRSAFMRSA